MRQKTKSPATSGKVHRAGSDNTANASRGKKYHALADLIKSNPQAHSVGVYAGQLCIGNIFDLGRREHHAFGLLDRPLGVHADRRAASTSIKRAYAETPESSRMLAS